MALQWSSPRAVRGAYGLASSHHIFVRSQIFADSQRRTGSWHVLGTHDDDSSVHGFVRLFWRQSGVVRCTETCTQTGASGSVVRVRTSPLRQWQEISIAWHFFHDKSRHETVLVSARYQIDDEPSVFAVTRRAKEQEMHNVHATTVMVCSFTTFPCTQLYSG